MNVKYSYSLLAGILILGGFGFSQEAWGFAFIFSGETDIQASFGPPEIFDGEIFEDDVRATLDTTEFVLANGILTPQALEDVVTHPLGYTGAGGVLAISVGVDPTSAHAAQMLTSTQNVVNTWNALTPTTGNLVPGAIPNTMVDFESVLLHEMGHAISLAHVNAATESGLPAALRDYTKATDGANNVFNLNAGVDAVIGSADDVRGDDDPLNWFRTSNNNPFTIGATVDSSAYSRALGTLPGGDLFSANPDRDVGTALGVLNTEASMQQGTFFGETQRALGHDDVAGLRYGMSGFDETQGNADDYTVVLTFLGLNAGADIVIDFDDSQTGFVVTQVNALLNVTPDHAVLTNSVIFFHDDMPGSFEWFFTPTPIVGGEFIPIDSTALLLASAQMNAAWMIPVVLSVLGIGLFVVSRKSE